MIIEYIFGLMDLGQSGFKKTNVFCLRLGVKNENRNLFIIFEPFLIKIYVVFKIEIAPRCPLRTVERLFL